MNEIYAFWGGVCSNWYPADFTLEYDGKSITFNCTEQHMMWEKARLFGDEQTAKAILQVSDPKAQKALGRKVKGYDDEKWAAVRFDIVLKGNRAKFSQNPRLLEKFIELTKGKTIVEASPYDRIWGIGLGPDDPRVHDRREWQGLNLLGKVLQIILEENS